MKCSDNQFKYQDLKEYLVERIRSGMVPSGGRIESEPTLSRTFGLSRNTVRQAISELENEGVLYRRQGQGTFVRSSVPLHSRKIALLIYDTAYMAHPVTGALIRGIDEVLSSNRFVLDVLAGKRGFHEENLARLGTMYAGFLIGAYQLDELTLRELDSLPIPHLFVKNYRPDRMGNAMRIDFARAGFLAAEHLIGQGCANLALAYSGEMIAISAEFRRGVNEAALEYGGRIRTRHVFDMTLAGLAEPDQVAARLADDAERPDGLICFSDEQAIALMAALKQRGIAIPDQLAVTGCNNSELAALVSPPLTSVAIPITELGCHAASMLLAMIGGAPCVPECLAPELVVRESSGGGLSGICNQRRKPLSPCTAQP